MSFSYTTTVGYGFSHAFTEESLDKFMTHFDLEKTDNEIRENLYVIYENIESDDIELSVYNSEGNIGVNTTMTFLVKGTYYRIARDDWDDVSPTLLTVPSPVPQALIEMARFLGEEDNIGWVFYTEVY